MAVRKRTPLDEARQREILAILSFGGGRETAASYVGCHVDTIRRTAERNAEFADALERAESRYEIVHLKNINAAASEARYWRAAAWALERRYPDRYGPRSPDAISPAQVAEVLARFAEVVVAEVSSADERQAILTRLGDLAESIAPAQLQPQPRRGKRT